MKKILALLPIIAAGVGGFLWWKRNQVIVANAGAEDPWPAAVAFEDTSPMKATVKKATAKKATAKKATAKKATAKKATAKKATAKKATAKKAAPKSPKSSKP